jgi:hypothetical protein
VNRDLLYFKLLENEIDGKLYQGIKAMYDNTLSSVRINDKYTDWFDTESGVRQGDTLSPTLFVLFINNLVDEIKSLNIGIDIGNTKICILLYADDIVLITETEEELQTLLNCINNWCYKWRITINGNKSKIMHFRKQNTNRSNFKFKVGSLELKYCEIYTYLGVLFQENLNFQVNANLLAESAGRALGSIISKYKSLKGMGFATFTKLFNACVTPILCYCSSTYKRYAKLCQVQYRAMRVFLGVHRFTAIPAMQGDMGWLSVRALQWKSLGRYWNRLYTLNDERITKQVFIWDKDQKYNTWSADMKMLLDNLDLQTVYNNNIGFRMEEFENNLIKHEQHEWRKAIESKPKLRLYVKLKESLETEEYVKMNLNRINRSYMAQLRAGTLKINIELGRMARLKEHERVCPVCNDGSVENELHLLFVCTKYQHKRNTFLNYLENQNICVDISNI